MVRCILGLCSLDARRRCSKIFSKSLSVLKALAITERVSDGRSVVSDSLWLHGLSPTRLFRPWDSPGKSTGVGCPVLFQGIFPAQGSNLGLLYCRRTLYHLSHQGSMYIYTHNNFIFCFYFPLAYLHAQSGRIWGESWAPGHEVFGRIICQFMTAADQSHV